MDETDFEGTLVLEKMAEINRLDEFFAAIDADDLAKVKALMKRAHLDAESIEMVLQKMNDTGNH